MTAVVLKFRRPAVRRREHALAGGAVRVTGFACTLQARRGLVVLTADGIQLELTTAQARELSVDLAECADDSESAHPQPKA